MAAAVFDAFYLLAFRFAAGAPRAGFVLALLITAVILNLGWSVAKTSARRQLRAFDIKVATALAIATVVANYSVGQATSFLGTGMTALFTHTQIFFVAALSAIFLGERTSLRFCVGLLVAGFGLVYLSPMSGSKLVSVEGGLWALAAAGAFASMLVVTRAVISRIDAAAVNGLRLLFSLPMALSIPGAFEQIGTLSAGAWASAVFAALCGPFACRLSQMYAVRDIAASTVRLLMLSTPAIGFALDWALFGDYPGAAELISAALITLGIGIGTLGSFRSPRSLGAHPQVAETQRARTRL